MNRFQNDEIRMTKFTKMKAVQARNAVIPSEIEGARCVTKTNVAGSFHSAALRSG